MPSPIAVVKIGQKAIVELNGISLRLSGTDRNQLEALWRGSAARSLEPTPSADVFFDRDRILAFALGKPVQAFGEALSSV